MNDPDPFSRLPLLADGDPATALRRARPGWRGPLEALNQEHPETVQAEHAAQARAGAELLRTNTAGAGAGALEAHGLADRAEAFNNSASALARQGLREGPRGGGFVMGTLAAPPRPELLDDPSWERALGEQVIYLSDTGVDFFLLHHVGRLADALTLTRWIVRATDAPVLAALRFTPHGRTEDDAEPGAAVRALADAGAGALGLCCGPGPAALPGVLTPLLAAAGALGLPVAVLAGLAEGAGSGAHAEPPYPGAPALDPAGYAAWIAPMAGQGVAILGGCCGVSAAHTRALALALGREVSG